MLNPSSAKLCNPPEVLLLANMAVRSVLVTFTPGTALRWNVVRLPSPLTQLAGRPPDKPVTLLSTSVVRFPRLPQLPGRVPTRLVLLRRRRCRADRPDHTDGRLPKEPGAFPDSDRDCSAVRLAHATGNVPLMVAPSRSANQDMVWLTRHNVKNSLLRRTAVQAHGVQLLPHKHTFLASIQQYVLCKVITYQSHAGVPVDLSGVAAG